ncbi:MAG: hypothetical protein HUJ29_12710 [Gammaproteobacteria bacterium]|nr:hypothetical protein [Gammaproteobacteria bacterium]
MKHQRKRLYLRVTVKLMFLGLVLALGITLLRSIPATRDNAGLMRYDLTSLRTGEMVKLEWGKRRVLLLRRETSDVDLTKIDDHLLDPNSRHATQPEFAETPWRSLSREYFIALDYGTDLNCELEYVATHEQSKAPAPWLGGFRDRCRGSWYDLAGRVYREQHALRNLSVPQYRIEDGQLLLGE